LPLYVQPFEERIRESIALSGTLDNRTLLTPEFFVENTIEVIHNGRVLDRTTDNNPGFGDYYISESGGDGTGYDTIVLLRLNPAARSNFRANYIIEC
jgi:hypothetical protein